MILVLPAGLLNASCLSRPAHIHASAYLAPKGTPNILIIVGDDHAGGTLGIDGDPRHATPRLDKLAAEGVRFRRAYCNAPVCTASRQSFLTGKLPHAIGVTQLATQLDESTITMADWLADRGFDTGAIGKMHFNNSLTHGFELRVDTADWRKWLMLHHPLSAASLKPFHPFLDPSPVWLNAANQSIALTTNLMEATYFADQAGVYFKKAQDRPFFLMVGFNEPHSPFRFPSDMEAKFKADDFTVPAISEFDRRAQPEVFAKLTPDEIKGIQAAYYNSIAFVDASVGRVLDALEASGHADDTIVVYLGDNGYSRGYHGRFEKHCLYEQAVRVPLVIRWPKHLPANKEVAAMVELVDLFPTVMDLSGEPIPEGLQGRSRAGLARGDEVAEGRDFVFSEYLENEEAMVRSDRYKLIVGTGARKRQDGYTTGKPLPGPTIRLYDEQVDPEELEDVSDRPEHAETIAQLQKALYDRLVSTREGIKPVPEGLSELDAIHWCLVPRDKVPSPPSPPAAKKVARPIKNDPSTH